MTAESWIKIFIEVEDFLVLLTGLVVLDVLQASIIGCLIG